MVKYREIQRKANVGETVKIVDAKWTGGSYENGDVFIVVESDKNAVSVHTEDGCTTIWHKEYVVLEPSYENLIANLSAEVARLSKRVTTLEATQNVPVKSIKERYEAHKQSRKTREEIVAQAKLDVEDLSKRMGGGDNESVGNEYFRYFTTKPEFIVNKEKRTVVALMRFLYGDRIVSKGIAKCTTDDCFNVHIGKAIALRRALGLEKPREYTHCPQPTEVKVGDVVKLLNIDVVLTVEDNGWEDQTATDGVKCGDVKVIDDSDSEVNA